jgi:hypothetical protein
VFILDIRRKKQSSPADGPVLFLCEARPPDFEARPVIPLEQKASVVYPHAKVLDGSTLHLVGDKWRTVDLSGPTLIRQTALPLEQWCCQPVVSRHYGLVLFRVGTSIWKVTFLDDRWRDDGSGAASSSILGVGGTGPDRESHPAASADTHNRK